MAAGRWWWRAALASLVLAALAAGAAGASGKVHDSDRLIGWLGEVSGLGAGAGADEGDAEPWIETLSWAPRAFVYHGFASDAECDALIAAAGPLLDEAGGGGPVAVHDADPALMRRVAEWAQVPEENAEALLVRRYGAGDELGPHVDYKDVPESERKLAGAQRVASVFIYLADVPDGDGGETAFPDASPPAQRPVAAADAPSACARGKLHVAPRKGDALLVWHMSLLGREDPKSRHQGCPVAHGEKWVAVRHLRMGQFRGA